MRSLPGLELSPGRSLWLMPVFVFLFALLANPGFSADNIVIESRPGELGVTAKGVDLRELLPQIAEHGAFKLWVSAALPEQPVSVDIEMMPLDDALRKLLANNSFAMVYGTDGAVTALYLLPKGTSEPINAEIEDETTDLNERMLQEALASPTLPDDIKAAMLSQFYNNNAQQQQAVADVRPAAIEKLIEKLQQVGAASPETMQSLQQTLARERSQQVE